MSRVRKFHQYHGINEKSFWKRAKNKILNLLFGEGEQIRTTWVKWLERYDLEGRESPDGDRVQIFHNGRLVADIERDERYSSPRWQGRFFLYESEIRKSSSSSYQSITPIANQSEQPFSYIEGEWIGADANPVIKWVIDKWSTLTKSGRAKNPMMKANSGLGPGAMVKPGSKVPNKYNPVKYVPKKKKII